MPAVGSIADAYAAVRAALGHLADARMEVERTEEMLAGLVRASVQPPDYGEAIRRWEARDDGLVPARSEVAAYPEGGWREHLADLRERVEVRLRRLEELRATLIFRSRPGESDVWLQHTTNPADLPVNSACEVWDPTELEWRPFSAALAHLHREG